MFDVLGIWAYLDIASLAWTKAFLVPTDVGYVFLANKAVTAIGVGFRRMFSRHFRFEWQAEEVTALE